MNATKQTLMPIFARLEPPRRERRKEGDLYKS
jgi:hypothetical protein